MSQWLIYGKHLTPWIDSKGKLREPDKIFRALDARGVRVTKLDNAMSYATKEDAQEVLDKPGTKARIEKGEVIFEVRRA